MKCRASLCALADPSGRLRVKVHRLRLKLSSCVLRPLRAGGRASQDFTEVHNNKPVEGYMLTRVRTATSAVPMLKSVRYSLYCAALHCFLLRGTRANEV